LLVRETIIPRCFHEFFSRGQNQCLKEENFKLLANFTGIHPRGVEEVVGLHPSLLTPRNGKLTRAPELLRRAYAHVKGARG
jgi:hypothetical protein